ncbi:uncharacterized protein [Epargyreus clarus]|uniref:uncharacterized protein n=1 Tax=Epargyreus clarus TaxID=520877 RepID=UPI003C302078
MEVAGQWRREWAGTAEYGKVTEAGVTRQVARAMEVLHASAPGARVRVMRAAYHSTAGPGAPASSYLLHSSRRVISSGYNFIEPDISPSKPLEISSTPLESSPDIEVERGNYKVTEPDDFEISEPSKWRASTSKSSIRMPSEESSSTDNASIIDLDYNNKNTIRKSTERFIPQNIYKRTSPISSLLDAPVTLSTLKYKSLLNGSDSWNNRRKSYSFEETPELDESILRGTDALTMESSTDSGICKSTEIVHDNYNSESSRYVERKMKMDDIHEETFKDWLSKNRQKPYINQVKSNKEHIINVERIDEDGITLQSTGKVSITLPTTRTDECSEINKTRVTDEGDRRTKKVEFCKTELHFAAESGKVNIIATDEKPPPSNDFRKKRSVFVPMSDNYNKSITLFGEKTNVFQVNKKESSSLTSEINTIDENTAATKSILKNKIPKPKPYLLGENMVIGDSIALTIRDDLNNNFTKPSGVSLINRQLQEERRFSNDSRSSIENDPNWTSFEKSTNRTRKISPVNYMRFNQDTEQSFDTIQKNHQIEKDVTNSIKGRVKILQMSPTPVRAKTRQLRDSDLTYFGVGKTGVMQNEIRKHSLDSTYDEANLKEEILHSVKLVKLISNSVCNSEVDSDEAPDYENLPMKYNFTPKPAPRSRSKYDIYVEGNKELTELNPILEKEDSEIDPVQPRRVKLKKQVATPTSRSLSEPPKANRQKYVETSSRVHTKTNHIKSSSISKNNSTLEKCQKDVSTHKPVPERKSESPLYINIRMRETRKKAAHDDTYDRKKQLIQKKNTEKKDLVVKEDSRKLKQSNNKNSCIASEDKNATLKRTDSEKRKVEEKHTERKNRVNRTKVLVTPEKSPSKGSDVSYNNTRSLEKKSFRERKVTNQPTQSSRTSKTEARVSDRGRVNKEVERTTTSEAAIKPTIDKKIHKSSTDSTSTKTSLKDQRVYTNGTIGEIKSSQPKSNKPEKLDNIQNKSRRSKYVINYDDKNGTVSSVCKIKPSHGSPRKKPIENYENKENLKDHTLRKDQRIKNDLLQLPEQARILYGNSKLKSKIHARPSCQIL